MAWQWKHCHVFMRRKQNDNEREISHFKKSKRSLRHKSGLDYTKIVISKKTEYIDSGDAIIDKDEYNELMKNLGRIFEDALAFVEDYVLHMTQRRLLHPAEFSRRYCHST